MAAIAWSRRAGSPRRTRAPARGSRRRSWTALQVVGVLDQREAGPDGEAEDGGVDREADAPAADGVDDEQQLEQFLDDRRDRARQRPGSARRRVEQLQLTTSATSAAAAPAASAWTTKRIGTSLKLSISMSSASRHSTGASAAVTFSIGTDDYRRTLNEIMTSRRGAVAVLERDRAADRQHHVERATAS